MCKCTICVYTSKDADSKKSQQKNVSSLGTKPYINSGAKAAFRINSIQPIKSFSYAVRNRGQATVSVVSNCRFMTQDKLVPQITTLFCFIQITNKDITERLSTKSGPIYTKVT